MKRSTCLLVSILLFLFFTQSSQLTCDNTPFTRISNCNITCDECTTWNLCQICPTQLRLLGNSQCSLPTEYTTIYFEDLFAPNFAVTQNTNFSMNKANIFNIRNTASNFTKYQTTICTPGQYKFNVLGFIKQTDFLYFKYVFGYAVSHLEIRFRLLSLREKINVEITVNNFSFYEKSYTATLGKLDQINTTAARRVVTIAQLNLNTASSLLIPVRTGPKEFDDDRLEMVLQVTQVQNKTDDNYFYAINEFVMIARKCQTCVSVTLLGSTASLGVAIGIAGFLLIFFASILAAIVKFQQNKSLKHFKKQKTSDFFRNRIVEKLAKSKMA